MSFGYKMAWLAVRSDSVKSVLEALNYRALRDCTWDEGCAKAYQQQSRDIFITSPIDGWILCSGTRLFSLTENAPPAFATFITDLSRHLQCDVQFFASHRVSEGHCWAKASPSGIQRAVLFVDGERRFEYGEASPSEPIGLPNEDDVLGVARAWSIDPSRIGKDTPPPRGGIIARERDLERTNGSVEEIEPSRAAGVHRSGAPDLSWVMTPRWAESAARGNRFARWLLEAAIIWRSSHSVTDGYRTYTDAREIGLVVVTVIVFEIAVFFANLADARKEASEREAFRPRMTRILVSAAAVALGASALIVDDALLLLASVFVGFGGFVAASYLPDALFGGTRLTYS